jgi:ribonuclease P protein component
MPEAGGFGASPSGESAGERLLATERVRRRTDYLRCYQGGRRRHSPLATLHFLPNQLAHPRIGITASRKVGKSVVRQRLKRRTREIYRRWQQRGSLPPLDLVVHFKPAAAAADFATLRGHLLQLFSSVLERP